MPTTIKTGCKPTANLDWTRDPPPPCTTPYQHFVRSIDWSSTSLGAMSTWSGELRQAVLMVMAESNPVILYWGDDYTMIYNEAHAPLVGSQHPQNMGKSAPLAFPEFWDYFDEQITEMRETGETRSGKASMLPIMRNGFFEELYFDWMLVPVICADGQMHGAYGRPIESTMEVFRERRRKCVQTLTQQLQSIESVTDLWQAITQATSINERDIPMAMIYTVDVNSPSPSPSPTTQSFYQLQASLGVSSEDNSITGRVDEKSMLGMMLSRTQCEASVMKITSDMSEYTEFKSCFKDVKWKGFGTPSEEYVILPILARGNVNALLVLGLNPHCRLDDDYRDFLQSVADISSYNLTRLQLALEVQKRAADARAASLEFQRSESKFSRFAERSPVGLALTDPYGKVQFANDAWLNFTGLNNSDVDISNWITTVHDDDVTMALGVWERLRETKQGETFQIRSKVPFERAHMRSSCRTAMCAIYPDLDKNGEVTTVMGLVLDISEQKWAEEQLVLRQKELENQEARYRILAERSPHGVVCTDEHGYVTFANDVWHNIYGFERGKVTEPEPWLAHLMEEDHEATRAYFQTVKQTDDPQTIEIRRRTRINKRGEVESVTQELWLLATGWAEFRPDGSVNTVVFWVTDITAQKVAAKVLEEKMEAAIRLKTQQERFIDMISHEIRNPLSAILHCGEDIVDSMMECLISIDTLPYPAALRPKDVSVQDQFRRHIDSARDSASTVMYCVQHQKQIVDDVLTLSKLDSDLLVVTPIPVQPGHLLTSVMKIFESEARSSDINLRVDMAASITDMQIDWIMLDPNRFLQIVINLVTNAIKFTRNSSIRNITIDVSARKERPPANHNGVTYIPQNSNARSKSQTSDLANDEPALNDQIYLCFSVTDSGKGLTEKESSLLFNRFAQGSPKTHTEYGGSGLGLFISRQITEMLGGEIGVGPNPDGGCRFAFYVKTSKVLPPRRASDQPRAALQSGMTLPSGTSIKAEKPAKSERPIRHRHLQRSSGVSSKRKVLVVEDNLVNQKVLCKQLTNRGYDVEAANHGREALDALHGKSKGVDQTETKMSHFDVILCDIEMPVMNGIECVTEIRRQEASGMLVGHIPIIGVTANVRSEQISTAIEVGMDGVTTKPYRMDELITHIDRVCSANNTPRSQSPSIPSS